MCLSIRISDSENTPTVVNRWDVRKLDLLLPDPHALVQQRQLSNNHHETLQQKRHLEPLAIPANNRLITTNAKALEMFNCDMATSATHQKYILSIFAMRRIRLTNSENLGIVSSPVA